MKKFSILAAMAAALALAPSVSTAGDVDPSKFCLGQYCLGDPIGKHGGLAAYRTTAIGAPATKDQAMEVKVPVPNCRTMNFIGLAPADQNYDDATATRYAVFVTPFPEHLSEGADSYYRVTSIMAYYPKIDAKARGALAKKIMDGAGVAPSKGVLGNYWWPAGGKGEGVAINVDPDNAFVAYKVSGDVYNKAVQNQPGCETKL